MRVWRRQADGKLVDAMMPEQIKDLVFMFGPNEVPPAIRHLVGPPPERADYFVVDESGPHYESESMLGNRTNLGTNIEAGALEAKPLFPARYLPSEEAR